MRNTLLLVLATLVLTACASNSLQTQTDFKQDYDFVAVRNIALQSVRHQAAASVVMSDMEIDRLGTALRQELEMSGYRFVTDAATADLLLSWHLVTQDKTDIRSYNNSSLYHCWRCGPAVTDVSVRQYTLGTLIVDLIEPDNKQSVWRSIVQSRLQAKPDFDAQPQRFAEIARAIFQQFPPH